MAKSLPSGAVPSVPGSPISRTLCGLRRLSSALRIRLCHHPCRGMPLATSRCRTQLGGLVAAESCRGKMCFLTSCLILDCQELLGKVLYSVAEEASLGVGSIKKANFVCISHLSQRWCSWTTSIDITCPRDRTKITIFDINTVIQKFNVFVQLGCFL